MFDRFWGDFAVLLATINPVGAIPLFVALTGALNPQAREAMLRRAIVVSAGILLAFLAIGEVVLEAMGVTLDAFRVAGGMVLLLVGLRMIFEQGDPPSAPTEADARDLAVFPLAMPLIAGPAAIMAVVLLTENAHNTVTEQAVTGATTVLVLLISYVVLRAAQPIQRLLGRTGINVIGRIMGLVLASLAVQSLVTGLKAFFQAGGG